jgi:Leucine Rich Repeat (LRR) protein
MTKPVPAQRSLLTPQHFLFGVLAIVVLLYLCDEFQWFGSYSKGWAPLAAVAIVGSSLLMLVAWYAASRFVGSEFRFSLRWLVLLVTVVAITLGWFAVRMQQAARQQAAIVAFKKVGGSLLYDWQMGVANARPPAPIWLCNLLGVDFYSNPYGIQGAPAGEGDPFAEAMWTCTDDDLAQLRHLKKLEFLALNEAPITDKGLAHIAVLKHLTSLGLNGTRISDDGLGYLSGCKELKSLFLGSTPITDAGLVHLQGLSQLEHLVLGNTQITGEGLQLLTQLKNLKTLHVARTKVNDADINRFKQSLPNCEVK